MAISNNTHTTRQHIRNNNTKISHTITNRPTQTLKHHHTNINERKTNTPQQRLHKQITMQISNISETQLWKPKEHIKQVHNITYIKVKSHQLNTQGKHTATGKKNMPKPCHAIAHSNHWVDKMADIIVNTKQTNTPPYTPSLEHINHSIIHQQY